MGQTTSARLRRDQRRGHAPAAQLLRGAIARQPGPAGSRGVDNDQRYRGRGERAEARVHVALASPATPPADDLGLPRLADRGHGDGVFGHIHTDEACGSVRPA
ncbi:MAG: hypothetical protein ACRERE_33100 [Candidatus Entotheonellia bacterium]